MIALNPIGVVKSPVLEGRDEHWGEVTSEIHISAELSEGLNGLEQFSHIVVVFWMHQSSFSPEADLVRRPRGRPDMPALGIFSQRAKHRPNPIGLTAVRLVERRDAVLLVQGLDAIDGTPVLDIKPYFPDFDSISNPAIPGWVSILMQGYFAGSIPPPAL